MTALSIPARPAEDASLRPVPWRRMGWVTWRQHRFALTGVVVFLGAVAVYVWINGLQLHHAYAAAAACHPATSLACSRLIGEFRVGSFLANGFNLQAVPALIGAFAGAPVLARELETGTFRYAWTQGFGRWRWALAKLVPLAVAVTAAAGAFSALLSWYYQPLFLARDPLTLFPIPSNSLGAGMFDLRGVAFAAWTLAAFAIGALIGMLIRRVVPAIAATLAAYAGLALAAGLYLREHYMTPLLTSALNLPGSAWAVSQWYTRDGTFAFPARGSQFVDTVSQLCSGSRRSLGPSGSISIISPAQCLSQHGYTLWTSYQPGSRFWPFQWIEGGWLLALSILLIAATVWLVRRRAA